MIQQKKIAFHTLGCKLNFSETSTMARQLAKEGFKPVEFAEGADVYVINTCSVTESADRECRSIIRRAKRYNPQAQVVVTGCYAQLKPQEIASIEGVDLVLGAQEKFRLPYYIRELSSHLADPDRAAAVYSCDINEANTFESSYSLGDRTRAFLKVQDGCDYSCTYCTIPLARGKSRSDTIAHVVSQAAHLAASGIKEVVLTGVNLGDFGLHDGSREENFLQLITALDAVPGIDRYRISSIEPNLLTNAIIEFVAASRHFMPHFHLPLQSGSDRVLALMKRRYRSALYHERIEKIISQLPHCCIGADVITGFPGEDEKEFLTTYQFLNELPVSYLHVFTYSERDHTEAICFDHAVPKAVRQERTKRLRILSEKKRHAFYESHAGETRPVLFESKNEQGLTEGFTDNYIKVQTESPENLRGQLKNVTLLQQQGNHFSFAFNDSHAVEVNPFPSIALPV